MSAVLEMKEWDVNATDCTGMTALCRAARRGHEEAVKMLLEREADSEYGWTPLSLAAENRREGVVKPLFEREDISPDQADTKYSRTPLLRAAEEGHDCIAVSDNVNQTPSSLALSARHDRVVRIS